MITRDDIRTVFLESGFTISGMKYQELIADLRSRINPVYAATLGTESYERRLCAEALEDLTTTLSLLTEYDRPALRATFLRCGQLLKEEV